MAERKFAIRFSVEDMEKVRTALKGMGEDGASALRAIERQSRQATPAMKAVDTAVRDVRSEFEAWANRIPVVGGALAALGPIGTGVAAALGGIVLGFGAITNASRQAMEDIGRLKDASDRLALSVVDLQSIRSAGMLSGINADEMDAMLATLATNSARASEGFGRMKAALDRVNPELSRQLATTTTQAERMDILARATQQATTYNEKLNIAVAAFGTEGGKMVAMLDETGAAMDTWKERARGAGLVLEEDLVRAVDAAADRIDILRSRTEVAGQRLAVALAPFDEWVETFKGNWTQGLAFIFSGEPFKGLSDQSTAFITNELGKLRRNRAMMQERGVPDDSETFRGYAEKEAAMLAELRKRYDAEAAVARAASAKAAEQQLQADAESFEQWLDSWYVGLQQKNREAAEKAAQEAQRKAAEAARLRAQQEKEAIDVRASLGDWTGKLAAEEERLNTLVTAGLLTRAQANAALAKTRGELDGSTAAMERWRQAVESAETPLQKAQRAFNGFIVEAMAMNAYGPEFAAAWDAYTAAIDDAAKTAAEATPEFKAVADARAKITAEAERLMSMEDKVAAYEEKQRQLIGVNGYTWGEAMKAVAAYRAELERASQSQRDNTFELRFSAEVLTGIIDENINSLEDLGKVALRVFRQMAVEWILANQKMAAGQGLFEWIGNALTSAFTGGGASTTPTGRTGNAGAKVHHDGRVIGSTAVPTRWVNSDIFFGAPRAHTGLETLRPGERPIIAEDGERMLSRVDNARVVRAIEAGAGGGPRVELHFHGAEGKPEVKETRGSDGSIRLDVMMRKAALDALSSTDGAKVMAAHYGIDRAVRT